MDYHLRADSLVKLRDKIYLKDNSEIKNIILRELHAKPYSSQAGYQKTMITVKKFYYWTNLKKEVSEFVARCLDC